MHECPLEWLQDHAQHPNLKVTGDQWRLCTPAVQEALLDSGFVVTAGNASHLPCPACDGSHIEPVIRQPGDSKHGYLTCPESGLVPIPLSALQQHRIDQQRIVTHWAESIGLTTQPKEIIPHRVWHWERAHLQGTSERWSLIIGTFTYPMLSLDEWKQLNPSPKTIILGLGTPPTPPDEWPVISLTGNLFHYFDFHNGTWLALRDDLMAAIRHTQQPVVSKPPTRKTAGREKLLNDLHTELIAHMNSSKNYWRTNRKLLLPPTQEELAKRCCSNPANVSRAINDDKLAKARVVKRLLEAAKDEEVVKTFDPLQFQ